MSAFHPLRGASSFERAKPRERVLRAPIGPSLRRIAGGAAGLAALAAGCGNSTPARLDGALGVESACGVPRDIVEGTPLTIEPGFANGAVSVACPGSSYTGWTTTPSQVFRYAVTGGGSRAVTITTATDATPLAADTILAVFDGDCDPSRVALACFDDARTQGRKEIRAYGTVAAEAGSHLTFVVGYYDDASNPVQVSVSSRENRAPSISTASALLLDDRLQLWMTATDPDGSTDVAGAEIAFVGPDGELIAVEGAATQVLDTVQIGSEYQGSVSLDTAPAGVAALQVRAIDSAGVRSATSIETALPLGTAVGSGAACDSDRGPRLCLGELECTEGTCTPSALVTATCERAQGVTPTLQANGTLTAHVPVTIDAGPGQLRYPFTTCGTSSSAPRTQGDEAILLVEFPDTGTYDVFITTGGMTVLDTILYTRTVCVDPGSSSYCHDDNDYANDDLYSSLTLMNQSAATPLYVIAELWDGLTTGTSASFDVDFLLRPVRASGESCDSAHVADRCAGAPCVAGVCP